MLCRIFFLLFLLFITGRTHAQSDTLFYNSEGTASTQAHSNYYKVFFQDQSSPNIIEKTFYTNHALRSITNFSDSKMLQKTDTAKAFYKSGTLHWLIAFDMNGGPIFFKQFYEDGAKKRIEFYKNGIFIKGKKYNNAGRRISFTKFQQPPKYNGGYDRMIAYLNRTVKYPQQAQGMNIKGTVYVSFIVTKEGTISHAKIIQSVHPLLDKEALRVIRRMKQWKAGKTNDEPINARISIPITFGKPHAINHILVKAKTRN